VRTHLAIAAVSAVLALFGARAEQRDTVKIGLILPLSGGMAHVGAAFRDAARLAALELPPGRFEYQLIFEDDGLQSAKAATAAQKLIEIDKVDAIISTWSYGGTVVAPIAAKAEVLHFGVAWDPVVAQGPLNFIHLTPPREFIKAFFAAFRKKGYRRIAAVGWHESGSLFFLDELERLAPAEGFQVVKRIEAQAGDSDFRSAIMLCERSKPDVYLVNFSAPAIDIFVRQAAELRVSAAITAITGFEVATDLHPLEGRWYVSDSTAPEDFVRRFTERYGHAHVYGVGNYYDSVKLIRFLFEQSSAAGKPDGRRLGAAAGAIPGFASIFGALTVDKDGVIIYTPVYWRIANGKRKTVQLDDI